MNPPPHILNPGISNERNFVDVVKDLRWGDYPGVSRGGQCNHNRFPGEGNCTGVRKGDMVMNTEVGMMWRGLECRWPLEARTGM